MAVETERTKPTLDQRMRQFLARLEYRRTGTAAEREAVYRLRYRAYLREGAISPNTTAQLWDRFDDAPNARLFGIHVDGLLVGSIRIHAVDAENRASPALDAFPDHLERELDAGRTIVDPNRFVADPDVSRAFPELPYATLRLPFMLAEHLSADTVTATVRAEHETFYRRVLRCRPVCAPRPYPTLIKPLGLMTVDFASEAAAVTDRHPFFGSSLAERLRVLGPPSPCQQLPAEHLYGKLDAPRSTAPKSPCFLPSMAGEAKGSHAEGRPSIPAYST
ncbi:hypothetical protein ILT44_25195 [Microvirga sp. BT689]|uniref:N-acyl amino acid synthase FeeM domain-containing protein n=1 Tax=Microvirga arvi TaxID=2778731 RepID=UPI0019509678|nr:hypothetical protein [Microvirga arvi]MBM6583502.1 hypothetical protein [Microvirga arvi]